MNGVEPYAWFKCTLEKTAAATPTAALTNSCPGTSNPRQAEFRVPRSHRLPWSLVDTSMVPTPNRTDSSHHASPGRRPTAEAYPLRAHKTWRLSAWGSRPRSSWTCNASVFIPHRMSVGSLASHSQALSGTGIIAVPAPKAPALRRAVRLQVDDDTCTACRRDIDPAHHRNRIVAVAATEDSVQHNNNRPEAVPLENLPPPVGYHVGNYVVAPGHDRNHKHMAGSSPQQSSAFPPCSADDGSSWVSPAIAPTSHLHRSSTIASTMALVNASALSTSNRTTSPATLRDSAPLPNMLSRHKMPYCHPMIDLFRARSLKSGNQVFCNTRRIHRYPDLLKRSIFRGI